MKAIAKFSAASRGTRLALSMLLVTCFALAGAAAWSQTKAPKRRKIAHANVPKRPKTVKVDLRDVDLPVFIRLVSDVTGKDFIFDDKVTGKVTVVTPKEISADGLYKLFLSVLQFKGYTVVPTDNNVIQIIPLSEAKQNWTQVVTDDKSEGFVTRVIRLNYINANDAIRVLTPLVSKNGVVTADSQTNTLILADTNRNVERLVSIVAALDKEPSREKRRINVYPLKNADAEELAKTLTALFSKQSSAKPGQPEQPPAPTVTLTGPVNVTADRAGNALVITAAPEDYEAVKGVIQQLDVKRRQVYVEAAIMEISMTKLKQLGIEFRAVQVPKNGSVTPFGGTNFGGITQAGSSPAGLADLAGLAVGVVKGTFTFRGVEFANIGSLVRALESEEDVNVLSTPHLLTTDNQKAEIVVGENVPFIAAQSQTTGGNVLTAIDRKDVGITLRLTPRVTEGDYVKLDLYQEISALTQDPEFDTNRVGPVISKRYASTTVVAKDGETIAIGGLIKDNTDRQLQKVPLLGDIPYVGKLFQYYKNEGDRTNLLILITPTIVKDDVAKKVTEERKGQMEKAKAEQMK